MALSKQLIPKIEQKCRCINRNRSNYLETIIIQDLQKEEQKDEAQQRERDVLSRRPV